MVREMAMLSPFFLFKELGDSLFGAFLVHFFSHKKNS